MWGFLRSNEKWDVLWRIVDGRIVRKLYSDHWWIHDLVSEKKDQAFIGGHEPNGVQAKSGSDCVVQDFVRTPLSSMTCSTVSRSTARWAWKAVLTTMPWRNQLSKWSKLSSSILVVLKRWSSSSWSCRITFIGSITFVYTEHLDTCHQQSLRESVPYKICPTYCWQSRSSSKSGENKYAYQCIRRE